MVLSRFFGSRRPAKEHLTRGGGYVGEIRDLRKDVEAGFLQLQDEVDAKKTLGVYGLQSSWAVDEVAGNDNAVGTSVAPLKSVTELNNRLSYASLGQSTTIQLVGNTSVPLELLNIRVAFGTTLTIQGTATAVATGTIGVVTAIGAGSAYPWQLDTTGIDWTTVTDRRFTTNTGKTFWVITVVDADTVIVTAGTNSAGTIQSPVAAETFTVHTLSTAPSPTISLLGGFTTATFGLSVVDHKFTGGTSAPSFNVGPRFRMYGCELTPPANAGLNFTGQNLNIFSSKIVGAGATNQVIGSGGLTITGCLFDTGLFQYRVPYRLIHSSVTYNAARLDIRNTMDIQLGGIHLRNVTGGDALTVGAGAIVVAPTTTSFVSGANNAGGVGINVQSGAQYLYQTSAKPTLTNATADTKIGGTNTAYASVPFVNTANNAQMSVLV